MSTLDLCIAGIGAWHPAQGDWPRWRAVLRGEPVSGEVAPRPAAQILPQGERRRAPPTVLLACEVAAQACADAGIDASALPCVFASTHGEVAISDEMCATLASDPRQLSPTRFHNSVHNAAVGYWTQATQCHAASNALSAWHGSFAAGLFEAAALACAEATPVLFAAYDSAAQGPLARVLDHHHTLALALLLDPAPARCGPRLRLRHAAGHQAADSSLALLQALALARPTVLQLDAGDNRRLTLEVCA